MKNIRKINMIVFGALALTVMTLPVTVAQAQGYRVEQGIAGISRSLDKVDSTKQEIITQIYNDKIRSPLYNKGVSKATNYVNVRKSPSTESEVVGKLYRGCAVDILEWLDGGWVKIVSGDVEGYIASDYLAIGKDAEKMAEEFATKYATVVKTQTLRVREEASTDSPTLELIPLGETFIVTKELDDWAEILLGNDNDGNDMVGYVHKDYLEIKIEFKEAISVEEELRIKRQQEEAERAEAERLRKLELEEKKREEEEIRRKAEEAERARQQKEQSKNTSKGSSQTTTTTPKKESSSASGTRSELVAYAKKFVGNPYVWGGTSLTNGADCSGFVYTIYGQFGYKLLRTSSQQASSAGVKVSESDLKPGDLIFYSNNRGVVNHVAIYIGDGQIVHAANSRQGIIISKYNYRGIHSVRRVIQ